MSIDFLKPLWLILLPVAFIYIIYMAKKMISSRFQRGLFSVLRFIVCSLLILAMAGTTFTKKANITTTIFAVDCSASTESAKQKTHTFLEQAQNSRQKNEWTGVVCFGEKGVLEQAPSEDILSTGNFLSYVEKDATNIEEALRLSWGLFAPNTKRRIVLLSDGMQIRGDMFSQGKILQGQNTAVDVYILNAEETPEVQLSEMELPKVVNKNTEYDIVLNIDSNLDTAAQVRLYKGSTMIADEKVNVINGGNRIVFTDKTEKGGGITYRAEIIPEKDTVSRNNQVYAYSYIADIPQVLLVEKEESGALWKKILEDTQVSLTVVPPEGAPTAMEKLGAYDGVILADISIKDLPDHFPSALETYVKTIGGGVVVSGGENSYALGGYRGTQLEDILPVEMQMKTEGEMPSLAMVMVIDRSGSMVGAQYGISKFEMAKEAVIRSLDGFQPEDSVGVIAFDDLPVWAVDLQKVGQNSEGIAQSVGNIQPGGGTSILPALQEAYRQIHSYGAKDKHIILLTDGQAEQNGYDSVLSSMNEEGITLSTIAVGNDTDTKLLKSLAQRGKGRYYFTNEFSDLPQIFAKETTMASKEYINNRTFYPETQDSSAILAGVEETGELDGYIASTGKSRADIILKSDKQEPILASWQYGLGRTASWTSDMAGQWTGKWFSNPEGGTILRNTLSWVMKKQTAQSITVDVQVKDGQSYLTVGMPYNADISALSGIAVASDHKQYEVSLSATAPGIYEGKMNTTAEGAYLLNLKAQKKDGSEETMSSGFHLPYPEEYNMNLQGRGTKQLQQLAELTGGRVLTDGNEVFSKEAAEVFAPKDMSNILMVLALLFFLLDIAFRRFPVLSAQVEVYAGKVMQSFKTQKNKVGTKVKFSAKMQKEDFKEDKKSLEKESTPMEEGAKSKEPQPSKNLTTAQKLAQAKRKRDRYRFCNLVVNKM